MKKLCSLFLGLFLVGSAAALTGTVVTVAGKVEMQASSGAWVPLKAGMDVPEQAVVSTGFKSTASIKMGASIITVKPLTRLTLAQLSESADKVATDLFVEVGAVAADVQSLNDKANDFQVRTPAATASVRGTSFTVTPRGISVDRGRVVLTSGIGQTRTASQGESLRQTGTGNIAPALIAATAATLVAGPDNSPVANENKANGKAQPPGAGSMNKLSSPPPGTVSITVTW